MIPMRTLAFLLLLAATPAAADPATDLAAKVQKVYDKVPSYTADFEQQTASKLAGQGPTATGTVAFKKPGKMHWAYKTPVLQDIISDGTTLWLYQPNDKQVVISDAAQYLKNRASITFLAGQGKLTSEFNVSIGTPPAGAGKGTALEMVPKKEDPTAAKVILLVDPKTGLVAESWVYDFMGNATHVRFTNAKTGRKLKDEAFVFTVPKGIDVIDQRAK